jgi:hypothetical protein
MVALQIGPSTFGILTVLKPKKAGKSILSGAIAQALMQKAGFASQRPVIEMVDLLAVK